VKIARLQVTDHATPVLALSCDGALYDVVTLERHAGLAEASGDFFERIVGARGAGLEALHARLLSGRRPTEARLREANVLPLPPFDASRAAYVQLGPADRGGAEPVFQHRDARAVVGDGQPVPVFGEPRFVDVGLGVVLGEDLDGATPSEARRAVLGYGLLVEWCAEDAWASAVAPPVAQFGPQLVLAPPERIEDQRIVLSDGIARRELGPIRARTFSIAESLAFLSHRVALRAGDLVGLGRVADGRHPIVAGQRLQVELPSLGSMRGWAARIPTSDAWRTIRSVG
jgi:hypothetical protein